MARFLTKLRKLVVIQCYAPTEQAITEEKGAFYETLENKLRNVKRSEITMVMCDLNAKVGVDNKNFEHTVGRHGLGTMNENGEKFAELCSNNNLVIGGTLFPHERIHKFTWESPDQTTQNQIDHKTIHKKWRRSQLDVRAFGGADVASDHQPLVGSVQLKIAALKVRDNADRPKFNTDKLKSKTVRKSMEKETEKVIQRSAPKRSGIISKPPFWKPVRKYLEEGRLVGKNGSLTTHGEGLRNAKKLRANY